MNEKITIKCSDRKFIDVYETVYKQCSVFKSFAESNSQDDNKNNLNVKYSFNLMSTFIDLLACNNYDEISKDNNLLEIANFFGLFNFNEIINLKRSKIINNKIIDYIDNINKNDSLRKILIKDNHMFKINLIFEITLIIKDLLKKPYINIDDNKLSCTEVNDHLSLLPFSAVNDGDSSVHFEQKSGEEYKFGYGKTFKTTRNIFYIENLKLIHTEGKISFTLKLKQITIFKRTAKYSDKSYESKNIFSI